jgi:hypothetical protein
MELRPTTSGRILFAGDIWCHAQSGLSGILEARLRLDHPGAPWRFWHRGEPSVSARQLLDEAALRLFGRDAHRVLVSIGHAPHDQSASPEVLSDLRRLLDLLSDKLPEQAWILLPSPSLWPESQREAALRIRETLEQGHPSVRRIDAEPQVQAFLAAQDEEHGASLCQPGPAPTHLGAVLLSRIVHAAWS